MAACGHMVKSLVVDAVNDQHDLLCALDHCGVIQKVDLRCWGYDMTLFHRILDTQPLLRDLTLTLNGACARSITTSFIDGIISKTSLLESLNLHCLVLQGSPVSWALICDLIDACPSLRYLGLSGIKLLRSGYEALLPQIQSLSVSDVHFGHDDIAFLLRTMPNLKTLDLQLYKTTENVFKIINVNEGSSPLIDKLPCLTTLRVSARWQHLTELCRFIEACCPSIRNLDLRDECKFVRRGDMLRLKDHFKQSGITLRRFAIDYEPDSYIEDWVRRILEECCPQLQELRIGSGLYFFSKCQDMPYRWRKTGVFHDRSLP
ncbi:hypothetical protein EDD21DRAFT_365935 [Dissophora ornata]|nr:hypothetical protein EDD21DRAFT_365935 [Dissophora ornata]